MDNKIKKKTSSAYFAQKRKEMNIPERFCECCGKKLERWYNAKLERYEDWRSYLGKRFCSPSCAALNMVEDANLITFLPESYIKHRSALVARPIHELKRPLINNAHWLKYTCHKCLARLFLQYVKEESKYAALPEFD